MARTAWPGGGGPGRIELIRGVEAAAIRAFWFDRGHGDAGPTTAMMTRNWLTITHSRYEHERKGLDFIRQGLPDHEPFRAWSNFEFLSDTGAVYEVDLLVLTRVGLFLVELKGRPGRVAGDVRTWTWTKPDGKV